MTNDQKKTKLREYFKSLFKLAETPITSELVLQDGTKVIINGSELVEGVEIFAEDGVTPITDGDIILEDGRTLTIVEGKVSMINEVEAPVEEEVTEELAEEAPVEDKPEEESTPDLESRVADLEAKLSEIMGLLEMSNDKSEQLMSKIEQFSKEPATDGITVKPVEKKSPSTLHNDEIELIKEYSKKFNR